MKRRNFLTSALLGAAIPLSSAISFAKNTNTNTPMIKPPMLKKGDTIGIIAPGTSVTDPDDIARVKEITQYFELNYVLGNYVNKGSNYKTRTEKERLDDLHGFFADKSINAVCSIRGGYGSISIIDGIDYNLIKANPKIFLGYSDITAMHLAISKMTGLVTFHGPVMLSSFTPYTVNNFQKVLFDASPIGELSNPVQKSAIRNPHPLRTIKSGIAKGRLVGGNLSLIIALMGTVYEIDTKGKILFIEDVGEEPYRIDRMLHQLRLAGKLKQAAGIVFGESVGCDYSGLQTSRIWDYSLGEVIDNILAKIDIPVLYGLTFGHTADQLTLPIGLEAELNADKGTLTITEAAVHS